MTPDQLRLLAEIEDAARGSRNLDERIAYLLNVRPPHYRR
jgi:hypothetical protein